MPPWDNIKSKRQRASIIGDLTKQGEDFKNIPAPLPAAHVMLPVKELDKLLHHSRIDPTEDIKEPLPCLQINDRGMTSNVCTLGNFSLAMGKAKSRKSFFAALTFSIVSGYQTERFSGGLAADKNTGVYFDTEQGRFHVQKLMRRICKMIDKPNPANIIVYSLRKYPPHIRLQLIEHALYTNDKIGFVVIDGVRDLVSSINDEDQATNIATKLLKWTEERTIHIMAVLHQNKGDAHARGHLGAELTNKAETVLSITKNEDDKGLSVVEAEYCRDKDFDPFAFTIDINELPQIAGDWVKKKPKSKEEPETISDVNIYTVLSKCFSVNTELQYSDLQVQIKLAHRELYNKELGTNKIKEIITLSKNKKWLLHTTGWRSPYTLGKYN